MAFHKDAKDGPSDARCWELSIPINFDESWKYTECPPQLLVK